MSHDQTLRDKSGRPLLAVYGWPDGAHGPQLVPPERFRPALERMQRAEDAITVWQKAGLRPWVVWDPWVEVQDSGGNVLGHPVGCLPEVIHLLRRKYPPDTAGLRYEHNRNPPTEGGAA
jgi:hypothetical protein